MDHDPVVLLAHMSATASTHGWLFSGSKQLPPLLGVLPSVAHPALGDDHTACSSCDQNVSCKASQERLKSRVDE